MHPSNLIIVPVLLIPLWLPAQEQPSVGVLRLEEVVKQGERTAEQEPLMEKKSESGPKAALQSVRALLIAARTARLSSEMQGRITSIPKKMGERFSRGDLLVAFDCQRQRAQQAERQAELSRAMKNLESKRSLSRLEAVSELDVELAQAEAETAQARLQGVRAELANCRILAPYDGRIVAVEANEFEVVGAGDPLMEIVETGKLRLELQVPSDWLRWLREGSSFTVKVDELGEAVDARVVALGARVDAVSQTVAIRAMLVEEIPGLRPGMSGDARFRVPDNDGQRE